MFGVIYEGIRVFINLDKSYYVDVAIIIACAIPALAIAMFIYSFLFRAKGKLYKFFIVVGLISLLISWPIGIIAIFLGLLFRHRAVIQAQKIIQEKYKQIIKLIPSCQPEYIDIEDEKSGWKFNEIYYTNRLSSIKFPQQLTGDINLSDMIVYDEIGENCSIGYKSIISDFHITAYIYKAHSNDLSDAFKLELENIANRHPELTTPSNQEFWKIDAKTADNNLNFAESSFLSANLCYTEGVNKIKSIIILSQHNGNYIKLRATWPSDLSFQSKFAFITLREVIINLTAFNNLDIFGIETALPT